MQERHMCVHTYRRSNALQPAPHFILYLLSFAAHFRIKQLVQWAGPAVQLGLEYVDKHDNVALQGVVTGAGCWQNLHAGRSNHLRNCSLVQVHAQPPASAAPSTAPRGSIATGRYQWVLAATGR